MNECRLVEDELRQLKDDNRSGGDGDDHYTDSTSST